MMVMASKTFETFVLSAIYFRKLQLECTIDISLTANFADYRFHRLQIHFVLYTTISVKLPSCREVLRMFVTKDRREQHSQHILDHTAGISCWVVENVCNKNTFRI